MSRPDSSRASIEEKSASLVALNNDAKPVTFHSDIKETEAQNVERVFEKHFQTKTMRKLDWMLLPILTMIYMCSSLDKSNLGNAKTLGMVTDIGGDPTGDKYALLNACYFITYAPFIVPFALLGKRTRLALVLSLCACGWGIAATCFAAVNNFGGSYACRLFIGLGEAGFSPLIQVYLSRFYTRQELGIRVAFWLAMAPFGGFVNGIVAYGVAHIHSHLESWRILFLIEGLLTLLLGVVAVFLLPEHIDTCRWLDEEEKAFLLQKRAHDMSPESPKINWKHARGVLTRWQQLFPILINMCQQVTGAALSAYLPTLTSELGFTGANAQIATLGPYGAAMVTMVLFSWVSDCMKNRGWPTQMGWWIEAAGFAIFLGAPESNRAARFTALILGEAGHYICTPLIVTWAANNAGNESRRAVAVPLAVSCAQAVAVGSGYLFPGTQAPRYVTGSAVCLALSAAGGVFTIIYQILLHRENKRRDRIEGGKPDATVRPDTATYADDAPGFRYLE